MLFYLLRVWKSLKRPEEEEIDEGAKKEEKSFRIIPEERLGSPKF